ncbi:hypothetical protein RF11_14609 [Thelohanellus kitauei]|uniref:Uncharacterized protein n=1 Tax=Thelohanellus kitauei TaxID=669202 RepID=A0A0C2NET7_THEKT|nr:hypothetical protein RF11_14609 [Thelohanellus kitauei]
MEAENFSEIKARITSVIKNFELKYEFWKDAPNVFIFYFERLHDQSNSFNPIMYVLMDGEKVFNRWTPMIDNQPLYVDRFVISKHILFGIADTNRTFFYVHKNLKLYSVQKYETDCSIIPSDYDPSYVMKMIPKNVKVI